jgi:hypothetical protein
MTTKAMIATERRTAGLRRKTARAERGARNAPADGGGESGIAAGALLAIG